MEPKWVVSIKVVDLKENQVKRRIVRVFYDYSDVYSFVEVCKRAITPGEKYEIEIHSVEKNGEIKTFKGG